MNVSKARGATMLAGALATGGAADGIAAAAAETSSMSSTTTTSTTFPRALPHSRLQVPAGSQP
jgi:hypothetical protein